MIFDARLLDEIILLRHNITVDLKKNEFGEDGFKVK